ncbi:hypothetical protein [Nonlabens dokdonensis]|uniref:hypothetical protein n=1 Tax=Nonlabens dokdonensis TaxID=328515 RepID=UPI0026E98F42|nr:hypothetical protein [Nonlabens dokdonensis]
MNSEEILQATALSIDLSRKMRQYAKNVLLREQKLIVDASAINELNEEQKTAYQVSYQKIQSEINKL